MIHLLRIATIAGLLALPAAFDNALAAEAIADHLWQPSSEFPETSFTEELEADVRLHVNAPVDEAVEPVRGTRLIVFATPNGNTIEQTLGCKMVEGLDWHYDIQHVAAQTRLLRKLYPEERIVLLCVEAKGLSWPNWRRTHDDANAKAAALLDDWRKEFGTSEAKVTLTGHSGGGAFKYGVIEGQKEIPDYIDRIVFLDSDYWFDTELHAAKFERWLNRDRSHRLTVICYDDRHIVLNGKKIVSDTSGTFRGARRMRNALRELFPIAESEQPPFDEYTGHNGQFHMVVHPNPENRILHTALVGDMNGLIHVQTLGTPQAKEWGDFGGPRAYTDYIQSAPTAVSTE